MNLSIKEIKLNQQGSDVFLLHQVLSAFGLAVSGDDLSNGVAGKETQKKVTLLQRQLHILPLDNTPLIDTKTISILKKSW